MEGQFITAKMIAEFKEHLILAERSGATVEKYIRDVKAFSVYSIPSRRFTQDIKKSRPYRKIRAHDLSRLCRDISFRFAPLHIPA